MAKYTVDAETGDLTQFSNTYDNSAGSIAASTTQKCHGAYSFALDHDTDGAACIGQKQISADEIWARMYFRIPSGADQQAWGSMTGIYIQDNTSFWSATNIVYVALRRYSGTAGYPTGLFTTGSGVTAENDTLTINADQWYCLELHWKKSATVGVVEVWLDDTKIVDQTGLNTSAYSAVAVCFGNGASAPNSRFTSYIDDCVVSDEGRIGPGIDSFQGQDVDLYEDFEDTTLEAGLTETDTGGYLTINSGTQYKAGSAAMALNATGQTSAAYLTYTLDNSSVSVGFWYRGPSLSDWDYMPVIFSCIRGGYADMAYIEYKYSGSQPTLKFWIGSNSSSINVSAGAWYWITGKIVRNSTSYWRLYDSTGAQVGSDVSYTADDYNIDRLRIGATDVHAMAAIGYSDEFVADWYDATYPLLGWSEGIAFKSRIIGGEPVLCLKGVSL